jgi:branched-chain amino acid transport system substrate-binding protein
MRLLALSKALAVAGLLISTQAFAQQTIKIGLVQPLTGSVAYNGTADVAGSKQAVDERNAKGGVLGKKIELVIEDGQCKPANSVNAAEKLIQKDKVVALSGAFCSSATAAIIPVAEKYKMPLITGVSSKADLTEKGNKYFFRATETDALLAKSFAKIIYSNLNLKNIAYIGVNDDWGRGGVDEFSKQMTELGAKPALKEYFDHGTTDFYTLLSKLRAS